MHFFAKHPINHKMLIRKNIEKKIVKKVLKHIPFSEPDNNNTLKKRRELFHFFVFNNLFDDKYLYVCQPKDENGDIMFRNVKTGEMLLMEITEAMPSDNAYCRFRNIVDAAIGQRQERAMDKKNDDYQISNSASKLLDILDNKNIKSRKYRSNNMPVCLLIVTSEETENCPVTGPWIDKFVDKRNISNTKYFFDEIYILDYYANPKDGSPVVLPCI